MIDFLVIGGGAAGLTAAIAAAECGDRVVVLEKADRVGKKILATGNGRCNLMNTSTGRYPGGSAFAHSVLEQMSAEKQRQFWEAHGLRLREEDGGRVYPACGQASAVLDILRLTLQSLGVEILTDTAVAELRPAKSGWETISADGRSFIAKRVLVAGGGCAQPKLGSDGSAFCLLEQQGIGVAHPRPALSQIETDTEPIRGLSGIRVKGSISIIHKGQTVHTEEGEILFAEYGISGVCTMQCSRFARKGDLAVLNLCRGMGMENNEMLFAELRRRQTYWPDEDASALFTGLCVQRLGLAIMKHVSVSAKGRTIAQISGKELRAAAMAAEVFDLEIRGVKGFDNAQVTAGGADVSVFDPLTLSCSQRPGLYAAGEVLDVDGDCGGFNLMFAFGSGLLAGLNGRKPSWKK